MGLFVPGVAQILPDLGILAPTYQQPYQFQFTTLQTLNSLPIALVTPSPTQIVIPTFAVQMVKAGTVVFSSNIQPSFKIDATGSALSSSMAAFDGSVSIAAPFDVGANIFGSSPVDYANGFSGVGSPLFLVGAADQTGGDGTVLTLILTYMLVDTQGFV